MLEPDFKEGRDVLNQSEEGYSNRMEDVFPERNAQFEVEHEDAESVPNKNKQLVVEGWLEVYVLAHQLSCLEARCAHHLVVVGAKLFVDFF